MLDAIENSDGTRTDVIAKMFETEVTDGLLGSFTFNENGDPQDASGAVVGFTIYVATDKLETVEGDLARPGGRRGGGRGLAAEQHRCHGGGRALPSRRLSV